MFYSEMLCRFLQGSLPFCRPVTSYLAFAGIPDGSCEELRCPYSTAYIACKLFVFTELQAIFFSRNSSGVSQPNELRGAEWSEFDFEAAMWVIPAELMKMKRPHTASVTRQGISLLNDLLLKTDGFFPSLFSRQPLNCASCKVMQDQTQGLWPIYFDLHMHIICGE